MNARQEKFVREYCKDFNASQAAIRAGYSVKSARFIGQENLTKPYIQAEIQKFLKKSVQSDIADVNEIVQFLTSVVRGDIGNVSSWGEGGFSFNSSSEKMPVEHRRLIKKIKVVEKTSLKGDWNEVQTTVELHDPVKAAELLGRYHGIWQNRTAIEFPDVETFELPKLAVPTGHNGGNGNGGHGD